MMTLHTAPGLGLMPTRRRGPRRSPWSVLGLIVALMTVGLLAPSPAAASTSVSYSDGVVLTDCALTAGYHGSFACTITAPTGYTGTGSLYLLGYYSWDGTSPNGYANTGHADDMYAGQSFASTLTWCQSFCGYGETAYLVGGCAQGYYGGRYYFQKPFGNVPTGSCPYVVKNFDGSPSYPSVTLAASPPTTSSNDPVSTLVATTSKNLAPPYQVSVYDSSNNLLSCSSAAQSTFSATVQPATNSTAYYTAFVARDCPAQGPPQDDVGSQAITDVENVGWIGSVTLTSDGASTPTVTATLGLPLVAPYQLSIYDDTGQRLVCTNAATSSASITVTPPLTTARTYTAYVAQDCPTGSIPIVDVRATAGLQYIAGILTAQRQGGVSVDDLATMLSRLSDSQIDALLLLAPGTHLLRGSLSDQQLEYDAARAGGSTIKQALIRAVAVAGTASAWTMWLWVNAQPTAPPAPPPPTPGSNPSPQSTNATPDPAESIPSYEDYLTSLILEQRTTLSVQEARNAARQCLALVNTAVAAGVLPSTVGGTNPCQGEHVFFMGSNSPRATRHAWDAITGLGTGPSNLAWFQLNYVSKADRTSSGLSRTWYSATPPCTSVSAGFSCDEYPFYSSAQSGPGASLRVIESIDNSTAGGSYGVFVRTCQLTSGGPVAATQAQQGSRFLVVPMTFAGAPPSFPSCARN